MKARSIIPLALLVVLILGATGCFTTWTGVRLAGLPGAPDESKREERVPQPGIQEHLAVTLVNGKLACSSTQSGTDTVYRAAYRYGKGWKRTTALMFLTESLLATAIYFGKPDDPGHVIGAGFLAVDAVGTAALFFIPRKEIYATETKPVTTAIREACPDGLVLEIASETYPIDAAGSVGELGQLALDDWMRAPNSSLLVDFMGRTSALRSDGAIYAATFDVPAGTLAQVALP